jgi:hypothetical protein
MRRILIAIKIMIAVTLIIIFGHLYTPVKPEQRVEFHWDNNIP